MRARANESKLEEYPERRDLRVVEAWRDRGMFIKISKRRTVCAYATRALPCPEKKSTPRFSSYKTQPKRAESRTCLRLSSAITFQELPIAV
jgi:hypothetical protein